MSEQHEEPTYTIYNDRQFRSDLHARWAVFFDTLGERWEYEKQAYDLPYAGRMVPDFWLPLQQSWVQTMPELPSEEELVKAADLSFMTRSWVYVVWGTVGEHVIYAFNLPFNEHAYDKRFVFTLSDYSGRLMVVSSLRGEDAYQFIGYCHASQEMVLQKSEDVLNNPRLLAAYEAAQRASFEQSAAAS
jgi:hypothetical protein